MCAAFGHDLCFKRLVHHSVSTVSCWRCCHERRRELRPVTTTAPDKNLPNPRSTPFTSILCPAHLHPAPTMWQQSGCDCSDCKQFVVVAAAAAVAMTEDAAAATAVAGEVAVAAAAAAAMSALARINKMVRNFAAPFFEHFTCAMPRSLAAR